MDASKDSEGPGDIASDARAVFEEATGSLTDLNPNALYHGVVLPPANFESVYDQRDNDEVLSDIRQVKSELESGVLAQTSIRSHEDPVVLSSESQPSSTSGYDPVAQVEVQNMLVLVEHQQALHSTQQQQPQQHQPSAQLQPVAVRVLHQEEPDLDENQEQREESHQVIHSIQQINPLLERASQHSSRQVHSQSQLPTDVPECSPTSNQLEDAIPPLQMILDPTINRQQPQGELLSTSPLQERPSSIKGPSHRAMKPEKSRPIRGEKGQSVIADVVNGTVGNEEHVSQSQQLEGSTSEDLSGLSQVVVRDNPSEVVTIKVEDRLPGESFMEVEVAPSNEVESESSMKTFCSIYINDARLRQEIAAESEVAEPLKDVIVTSEIDDELKDLIKLRLKTFENIREDAATQLLAIDALLAVYQKLLRKVSIPVLELGDLLENCKAYSPERIKKIVGSILCQLVMFNERVIRDRRVKVLTYLGKSANLADGHRIPHRSGEALFGKLFIEQHHLIEMKRSRRTTTRTDNNALRTATVSRAKRRRKNPQESKSDDWANRMQADAIIQEVAVADGKPSNEAIEEILEEIKSARRSTKRRHPKVVLDDQVISDKAPKKATECVWREKSTKQKPVTNREIVKLESEQEKRIPFQVEEFQSVLVTSAAMLPEFNSTNGTDASKTKENGRRARVARKAQAQPEMIPLHLVDGNNEDNGEEDEESYDDDRDADFPQPPPNDEELEDEAISNEVSTQVGNKVRKKSGVPFLVKVERKLDNNCDHCEYVAEKRRQLVLHVKNVHADKMIACDACDKRFAFKISLWNHKNAMHLGAEHKCPHPHCTRSFKDEDKLRTHLFVHSAEKPFTCDICGRGCLTKVHLDSHVKVHERRDTQYCQTCNRYFGSNHTFRNHMKLHAGKKEWFCDICNAGFPIKPRLVLHKKIAHSDEQFICDECGKGFKMKHILNDHKALIHSTRKAFVCEVCGVGFKLRSVLRRHMKTHSDERPHKCELCDKAFKVKSTLVEHRKTHTNEKPFLCEQCGVAFKRNAERRKHSCMSGTKHVVMQVPLPHLQSTTLIASTAAETGHAHDSTGAQLVTCSTGSTQVQLPQVSTGHAGPTQLQVAVVTSGGQAAAQHLVAHVPLQLGAQMIQIMSPGTLVSPVPGVQTGSVQSGGQLMVQQVVQQLHDAQHSGQPQMPTGQAAAPGSGTSAATHTQFANFSVS